MTKQKTKLIVSLNGSKLWYLNGKLHREDGPAVVRATGTKAWWIHGKRHREDGPAVIFADGQKEWHIHGQFHREDGPAIIRQDGYKEWWWKDKKLSKELHTKTKKYFRFLEMFDLRKEKMI